MTTADLVARAQALMATADRALYTHWWSIPRARYLQALSLLEPSGSTALRQDGVVWLRRAVSARLAVLAALEGNVAEAHNRLAPNVPYADADLLDRLAGFAHDKLHEDFVAETLLRRAHDLVPHSADLLTDFAEVRFATGQKQLFTRVVEGIDVRRASVQARIALAALTWASSRLARRPAAADAARLLHLYRDLDFGERLSWSWDGTKHALLYGRYHYEDAKPIVDVLTLLEQDVTDDTRAQLAALLAAPPRSPAR